MAKPTQSLQEQLLSSASRLPFKDALRVKTPDGFQSYTYSQLVESASRIAAFLMHQGIQKGERVALLWDNGPEWIMSYFGIVLSGAVAVPLDVQNSSHDISGIIVDAGCSVIISSQSKDAVLKKLASSGAGLKKIIVIDSDRCDGIFAGLASVDMLQTNKPVFPQVGRDDIASLLYTSGTVAKPKGVILTHGNFLSGFESCRRLRIAAEKDVFISILPLFHAYSFMATALLPLFTGATIVFPTSLKSAELQECMKQARVSILAGVPQVFYNIHKAIFDGINKISFWKRTFLMMFLNGAWRLRKVTGINLARPLLKSIHQKFGDRLRFFISGGARLDATFASDLFKLGFTILEGYGLTETSPVATFNRPGAFKIGSIGKALPGVSIKIVNPDAAGQGEIAIRGENVMKGYFNKPAETAEALEDGWLLTGDLGYIDRKGFIFITGRAKEIIVLSSGKNIYPEEVETYYQNSVAVKELCVLEVRDERGLESLQAVVVPDFDYFAKAEGGNIQRKIKWEFENISHGLPTYKRISGFILSKDELPRTRLGKIKRYEVRQRYLDELTHKDTSGDEAATVPVSEEDSRLIQSPLANQILGFLQDSLSLKKYPNLDDHLELDLGVDSLAKVELVAGLEKLFGISISDAQAQEITTVRQIILRLDDLVRAPEAQPIVQRPKEPSWSELLSMEPPDEIRNKIVLHPGLRNKVATFCMLGFFWLLCKLLWRFRVEGKKNIPKQGPFILASNHASYMDGVLVAVAVSLATELNLYFIGWKQIFEHPLLKWSNKMARLIPIDSSAELTATLQIASYIIRNKKNICIFPEGQRTIDGEVKEFRKGVGILIKELDTKVVPVAIKGSFEAWPRTRSLPRPYPITVTFGKPIGRKGLSVNEAVSEAKNDYEHIAATLREKVTQLLKQ